MASRGHHVDIWCTYKKTCKKRPDILWWMVRPIVVMYRHLSWVKGEYMSLQKKKKKITKSNYSNLRSAAVFAYGVLEKTARRPLRTG